MKKYACGFLLAITCFCATAQQPRYNEVFQAATHNSYFVKRAKGPDPFAGGVQERILDQLIFDHARTLEIDIHKKPHAPGQWQIYHTSQRKNSFFADLPAFLKQLLQFHATTPRHEVVTVILELKEILGTNFDETHTPADLDKIITNYLGMLLFTPGDLLKRCPGDTTLCDCAASSPAIWPTIEELRGKFIFVVLGNWHWRIIGHGGLGWATYACSPNPVAFPMSSSFSVFNNKRKKTETIPRVMLAKAYQASIFKQAEQVNDTSVAAFISRGGIVRGGSAQSVNEQGLFVKSGFQMFLTDYPWIQFDDCGFTKPFRPLNANRYPDTSLFIEPGNRIFMDGKSSKFRFLNNTDTKADWQTLPSSARLSTDPLYPNTHNVYGIGCLRAESADGKCAVVVCREMTEAQNVIVTVKLEHQGYFDKWMNYQNTWQFPANGTTVGDMIRLSIEPDSTTGSMVRIYSSAGAGRDKENNILPVWNEILSAHFNQSLPIQGLATKQGDVLFAGTKLNGANVDEDQLNK